LETQPYFFCGKDLPNQLCVVISMFFYFSFYKMPKEMWKILVEIQIRFLWGGDDESKKIPWGHWEDICKSKEMGGLGVKNLYRFNETL